MTSKNTPVGSRVLDRIPSPSSSSASFRAPSDGNGGEHDGTARRKGARLLFAKSKVYIHPTRSEKDNVPGYVALLQQVPQSSDTTHGHGAFSSPPLSSPRPPSSSSSSSSSSSFAVPSSSDLLLAWVPESSLGDAEGTYIKVDMTEDDEPPRQTNLVDSPPIVHSHMDGGSSYAFAIPLSAIFSLQVRPPSPGWFHGSIVINSRLGATFPSLFFHDSECRSTLIQKKRRMRENFDPFGELGELFWGGHEVLRWVRRYTDVERSVAEPNMYLVEPTREDSRAFGASAPVAFLASRTGSDAAADASRLPGRPSSIGPDPFMQLVREAGWNVMERFSRVTTFTRRAAREVLESPNVPPQVRRLIGNPDVRTVSEEYESARIYLARWALGIAEQSERERGGRDWTDHDVVALEETDVGEFEILQGASNVTLADRRKRVTLAEWEGWFDPTSGRLQIRPDEVRERVFHGGLHPDDGVRAEAWLFLLGVYDWQSTADERKAHLASLRDQYYRLKNVWWERLANLGDGCDGDEEWREQRARIEKDVHRTDRNVAIFKDDNIPHPDPNSPFADVGSNVHLEQLKELLLTYNEYNLTLGYVQGMSDLLAPIYAVVQDDAVAFWAFAHFMDRMERNFLRDQTGMRAQLLALDGLVHFMDPRLYRHLESADSTNFFFFFRMLLVWYKREFAFEDVLRLWEALWTDYLSSNFHLFVALAILEKHRHVIMDHLRHFDEVLKYVNELSNTIDLGTTIIRAESLFRRFSRMVDAVDKRGNFPAPRTKGPPAQHQSPSSSSPRDRRSPGTDEGERANERVDVSAILTPALRKLLSRKVDWARTEDERRVEWKMILAEKRAKVAERAAEAETAGKRALAAEGEAAEAVEAGQ